VKEDPPDELLFCIHFGKIPVVTPAAGVGEQFGSELGCMRRHVDSQVDITVRMNDNS
jgi:hypothetical protein